MLELVSNTTEETMQIGERLGELAKAGDCIVLMGDLGAGKTQFAKGFACGMGVNDDITSPTFPIVLEYIGEELPLLHFDLYRLDEYEELDDIDFDGMLESGGVSLVEWGDKFPDAMPDERLDISILIQDDESRVVRVEGYGARGAEFEHVLASNR